MTARRDVSPAIEALGVHYPLKGLHPITVLPTTGRNVNAIMADASGTRFVLRCCRRNTRPERIQFQLDFQLHLRSRGIPTADVISTSAGRRLVDDGRHIWVLFSHIAGTEYDYARPEQLRNAAQCLTHLHAAAESFTGSAHTDETIPDVRRWWTHGLEYLAELHRMFARRGVDAELAFLDRWLANLIHELPLEQLDRLPRTWVHGDFHGGNLAFRADRVAGVFDYDVVHRGFRLEDVAHASFCFSRENATSNRIRTDLAGLFRQQFALTESEREAFPALMVATQARNAARYRIRQREGADPAKVLHRHVARMRELSRAL